MSTLTIELDRYNTLTREALEKHLRIDASQHYLADPIAAYPRRKGKGLRPAICIATCEAFGGTIDDAMPSAVALELLHNAFLIHDDIEDESEMRRGEPTLHRMYGTPLAINAGDGLALAGMGALADNNDRLGPELSSELYREFDFMARQTVDGQALDLGWRIDNRLDLTPDDYLELIMKKTCWYTTVLPLRAGALIGSRGKAELEPMIEFGFHLGAAFQIQDDVLNLVGDTKLYGKELLGDLRESKRSLILIHLLAVAPPAERAWIEVFLGDPAERTPAATVHLRDLMEQSGSIAFAREFARGIAHSASTAFEQAFAPVPASSARSFIGELIPYMLDRER